jgi:hypothetical protein
MPAFDKPNEATLFDGGIVGPTVDLALKARQQYPWAAKVPTDVFFDAVLPYANVNEARSNWRPLLVQELSGLFNDTVATGTSSLSLKEAALLINKHMWALLGAHNTSRDPIAFKSEQTPLVYDPMSTMAFGYASCTGISILYVSALRAFGIPARLVGTPAWQGVPKNGNHNWVEVYLETEGVGQASHGGASQRSFKSKTSSGSMNGETGDFAWYFIEGQPAGPGEGFDNPCDKWFCNKAKFPSVNMTRVYATAFNRSVQSYPMVWDLNNSDIAGVDRTVWYNEVCGKCGSEAARNIFI